VFWDWGNPRNNTGERTAFLETTPEHHPQGQPIYKVRSISRATFDRRVPPLTLHYRNDDGGPGYGKTRADVRPADDGHVHRQS